MKARARNKLTLQDVVKIVSQFARSDEETTAVVTDLLNRGIVRRLGNHRTRRFVVR